MVTKKLYYKDSKYVTFSFSRDLKYRIFFVGLGLTLLLPLLVIEKLDNRRFRNG